MASVGIEKKTLAFVLWSNIACNALVHGEENKHCLRFICWPIATHDSLLVLDGGNANGAFFVMMISFRCVHA